jgi:N-acetylglucosaminyl-diphospho-decaprenol L-rhamnosyltransferase
MEKNKYSITFACYNAVEYTKLCIESFIKHDVPLERLVVVDNGSNDATKEYLKTLQLGGCVLNNKNLGCGVAWNQGALEQQAEWSIIMNNDVIVSKNWIENLIEAAELNNLKIISPSLIEGPLDYNFDDFSSVASTKMKNTLRLGNPHAVCLAVHESVWMDIGYFQPIPKLWGYEDTIFFHKARKAGIQMATTGASWLHHFGSITQSEMKRERGLQEKQGLGGRFNYRHLNQSWLARKLQKREKIKNLKIWRSKELSEHGMTLHGVRENGEFRWL